MLTHILGDSAVQRKNVPQGIEKAFLQAKISARLYRRLQLMARVRQESVARLVDGLLTEGMNQMEAQSNAQTRAALQALATADAAAARETRVTEA